jgi:NADH-quinone oxidoreductase subunit C
VSNLKKNTANNEIGVPEIICSLLRVKGFMVKSLNKFSQDTEFIYIDAKNLIEAVTYLKTFKETQFDFLYSISGVDYGDGFEVVYHLQSTKLNKKLVLKTQIPKDNPVIDSLANIYPAANWHERETYDLLGIIFIGHPDLRRILLPESWKGHPLRKDYVMDDERLVWNAR